MADYRPALSLHGAYTGCVYHQERPWESSMETARFPRRIYVVALSGMVAHERVMVHPAPGLVQLNPVGRRRFPWIVALFPQCLLQCM
jgi:hypothetical protein